MPAIAHNWYARNSLRRYPIDDNAHGENSDGMNVPHDILVDCRIRFPETAGRYAFISSLGVTDKIVSITFLGSLSAAGESESSYSGWDDFVPLGAVTVAKSKLKPHRHYQIEALYPGVGGWVVFGEGVDEPWQGRFDDVNATMLAPKIAQSYDPLPVLSLQKQYNATALTGVVLIKAGNDMQIVKETRTIDGYDKDVLAFSLSNELGNNALEAYLGPCDIRPESGNCDRPAVEFLNTVAPDCDGNITLNFLGQVMATPVSGGGGIILDTHIGLIDACTEQDRLPTSEGILPNEFNDLCFFSETSSELSSSSISLSSESESSESSSLDPESFEAICDNTVLVAGTPRYISFDTSDSHFMVQQGTWEYTDLADAVESPEEDLFTGDFSSESSIQSSEDSWSSISSECSSEIIVNVIEY